MKYLFLLYALSVSTALKAAPPNTGTPTRNFTVQKGLIYSPPGWPQELKADVCTPQGSGLHAAVLLVHGGGWRQGDRSAMAYVCGYLAQRGYAAVTIDYRLAPQFQFPAQLQDVQQAMHWLHRKADSLAVDSRRIGVFGLSAGGHLATLLGTVGEGDPLDSPYGGPDTRVKAVVAGAAPTDLRTMGRWGWVRQFLGGPYEKLAEAYALASPVTHVSAGDPPHFLYHGTLDEIVPFDQGEDMKRSLDAVGVSAELMQLSGMGHTVQTFFDKAALEASANFLDRVLRARVP